MTNRRSFFKLLGLTAGAVATAAPAVITETKLPPIPGVKSKRAYVTSLNGWDWVPVRHGLNSLIVCAAAATFGNSHVPVEIEPVGLDECRVRVPKPRRTFMSWLKREPQAGLHRLIVYIPQGLDHPTPTYAQAFSKKQRS